MQKIYNLIIVDDHPVVLNGLKTILSRIEHINIVKTLTTGLSCLESPNLSHTDIILMDIFLPDMNGIDLCLKIKKKFPKIIILAMSSQSERSIVMQMVKNGANGYLLKSANEEEFRQCINKAIHGNLAFSHEVEEIVNKAGINDMKNIPRLTKREKEILELLIKGKSTMEISETLFLSFLTVQTHRRNLLNKFQVKNVIELINFAKENGLL